MKLLVMLERDETGMLVVQYPAIPGCISKGRTEAEALSNIVTQSLAAWRRARLTECR